MSNGYYDCYVFACGNCLQPTVAAKQVYTLPVKDLVDQCECVSATRCLIYLSDLTCSAVDTYVALSKLIAVIGLQNATLTVLHTQLSQARFTQYTDST